MQAVPYDLVERQKKVIIMERKVTSSGSHGKAKMETHEIRVKKMANGFSVEKRKRPVPGTSREAMASMPFDDGGESPQVFTKHSAANKHIQAALQEMHPSLPPAGGDDAGPPQVPPPGQTASATEPS